MNVFEIELASLRFEELLLLSNVSMCVITKFIDAFEAESDRLMNEPGRLEQWVNDFEDVIALVGKRARV